MNTGETVITNGTGAGGTGGTTGISMATTTAPGTITLQTPAAPAAAATDWTSALSDDMKGYVQNKGFKDPSMALDSYRQMEKLMGVPHDRLAKLPEKADDPAWNDVYQKLGKPQSAELYKIDVPKDIGDEAFANDAKKMFYEANLTGAQAEKLTAKWNEYQRAQIADRAQAQDVKIGAEMQALQKEWGPQHEENIKIVQRASQAFGLDQPKADALIQAFGYKEAMQFMHKIGSKIGEDNFVIGQGQQGFNNRMSPESAKSRIKDLRADSAFMGKYLNGDSDARRQMGELFSQAHPGQTNLY
jgi:hypothetical protein